MRSSIFVIVMALSSLFSFGAAAQQSNACITIPGFSDFDFWLGEWDVQPFTGGAKAGENTITKIENGCAVEERWTDINGVTGRSLNYYIPATQQWRQIWVSSGAYSLDIVGGLNGRAMVLEGTIHYYPGGAGGPDAKSAPIRGIWTPQEDGSVRQFFEQYNAETDEWQVWFDGRYVRKLMHTE